VSTKQLYLVIRLPESSSTSVSLLNSSSTYIPLLINSSTSVPLLEVVVHLYHSSPRVVQVYQTTIIGLVKLEYLYSYTFHPNHIIYSYTKQRRKPKQTHRKQMFRFSNISCITNQYHLLLVHTKQRRRNKPRQSNIRTNPYKVRTA